MRARRGAQPPHDQRKASQRACARLARSRWFQISRTLSAYWPVGGELDLRPLLQLALRLGKHVYLPVVEATERRLRFARYAAGDALRVSRYGLSEPREGPGRLIEPRRLDLVLLPLVAFDTRGTRLGMGGGYYDRTFAGLGARTSWRGPRLVGVAFELQRVATLERASWDVPIDAVVTDRATYRFMQE
jgi:5-formyltetrahydrofolate cyclo-ligase